MKFIITLSSFLTAACMAEVPPPQFPCCAENKQGVSRPDTHAPISIMGDHTHAEGGWMLSYRFMQMSMNGMRHGNDRLSSADVFAADSGYTVTPTKMSMDMHMFGLMYASTNQLTFMLMANFLESEMDHQINPAAPAMLLNAVGDTHFTTKSRGWGDIKLTALYRFYLEDNRKAHFGLGLSMPTGSIDKQDKTPKPGMPPTFNDNPLPAPMQLGSGTFDLLPSLTYVQQFEDWSWGAQANGIIRMEKENENGYRLGHVFELLSWSGYNLSDWLALKSGLSYKYTGKLNGTQEDIGRSGPNGRSVTTAFKDNYGGQRVDAILGVNLLGQSSLVKGHRLSADIRLPLWQDLNGYQLEIDTTFTIGWQKSF